MATIGTALRDQMRRRAPLLEPVMGADSTDTATEALRALLGAPGGIETLAELLAELHVVATVDLSPDQRSRFMSDLWAA